MKHLTWITLVITLSAFSQAPGNGVTDIDGNQYNTVIIGTQEWMKENLQVSKYSDGTPIPQVTDPIAWSNLTTGAWCYYNNDTSLGTTYGKMYNWYAVAGIWQAESNPPTSAEIASRKSLAPSDWNVPSVADWSLLFNYLEGNSVAGGKMKEAGLNHWLDPNTDATNSSGFTGLPGGYRPTNTLGQNLTGTGHWWCSDYLAPFAANFFQLSWISGAVVNSTFDTRTGISVRWVKSSILGNETFINQLFNIYPNPAKDYITIDVSKINDMNSWSYKIVNALGQKVLYGVLNSQQDIIQLSKIGEQGVYFVKVYDKSNTLMGTKKLIIQQ
jgi:uncharacterized protein (TIGR02145 family)